MRSAMVAVVLALAMAGGCAAEKERVDKEEKISATRLGGKFRHDDPLVQMLSPEEVGALDRAGMLAEVPEGEDLGEGKGDEKSEANKTPMDKAGDVMMSVLSVGVTLGMMAAPYLLF